MIRFGIPVVAVLIVSTALVGDAPPLKEGAAATGPVVDDRLPAGAIARFGSKRAMHGISSNIVLSPTYNPESVLGGGDYLAGFSSIRRRDAGNMRIWQSFSGSNDWPGVVLPRYQLCGSPLTC